MKTKKLFIKRNKVNILLQDEQGNTIVYVAINDDGTFYNKECETIFYNVVNSNISCAILSNTLLIIETNTSIN